METSVLMPFQGNSPKGKVHHRSLECDSGQAFQTQSSDSTEWSLSQQVFSRLCSRWTWPQVDWLATRFNHKLPQFVSPVPDPAARAVDTQSLPWGIYGCVCFSFSLPDSPSDLQDEGSGLSQNDSYCPRLAKHVLVFGTW